SPRPSSCLCRWARITNARDVLEISKEARCHEVTPDSHRPRLSPHRHPSSTRRSTGQRRNSFLVMKRSLEPQIGSPCEPSPSPAPREEGHPRQQATDDREETG